MALITANNLDVLEMKSNIPLIGVWGLELIVDSDTVLAGDVSISIANDSLVYKGTAVPNRSGEYVTIGHTRIVGGKGGLLKTAEPKAYQQIPLRNVLQDLLSTAGETLSNTSNANILGTQLPFWTTVQQPVSMAIVALLGAVSGDFPSWRILADGTFWVGYESWPASQVTTSDFELLNFDPREAKIEIVLDAPIVQPGTKLGDFQVSYVEHAIKGDSLRQHCWLV